MTRSSRRWWALSALVLSLLTIGFDATILNVALPTISADLSASTGDLQWIIDSYVLVFAGLLLPAGALGDRYGRKRLILTGLALFGTASIAATWAGSTELVIAARIVMGLGAAIIMPTVMAVLPVLFGPAERGKAISLATMGIGIGIPLGPIIGGYLLGRFWWGSIFLINVPLTAVALIAVGALLPESRDPVLRRPDLPGGLLSTVGLLTFVYGVIEAPSRGWSDALVVVALGTAVGLLGAFVWWERRCPEPMIDLSLSRRPRFGWGTLAATLASFALFGLLFVVPQYLQFVLGADALGTGIRLLPLIGGLVVGAPVGERVVARVGYRLPIATGLLVLAIGLGLGSATRASSGYGFVAGWLAVAGVGVGLTLAPAMDAVLSVLPPERAGSGTAITMTLRQAAGALGVALLGSLLSAGYTGGVDVTGLPAPAADAATGSIAGALAVAGRTGDAALATSARAAYLHGMSLVLVACAVVSAVAAVLVAVFLPRGAGSGPEREESEHELARIA